MTTRFSLSRIGRASLITIGAIAAMAAPLGAQAPARAKPAAQTPAPTGPVMDLSMDQAVNMSMETNLGLKAAKINVDVAAQGIVGSRAAFLPQLRGQVSTSNSDRTASSFTDLGATTISNGSFGVTTSVSQFLPWYGGSYQVAWSNSRSTTSSVGASFNPTLSSSFSASYTQPLLQGFKVDSARVGLETSERLKDIADLDYQTQIVTLQAQVRDAYLNLVAAVESQKVIGENMDAAQQLLDRAKASVAVGASAQIEVTQAEANVATNEVSVIGAQAQIDAAQDALRSLILDPSRPDYWDVQFNATDKIEVSPHPVDVNAAITNALANRIDLIEARKNIAITDLNLRLDKDLTRPAVTAGLSYSASGTGGTQNTYTDTLPLVLISQTTKGFGSVLGDAFGGAFPSWSVGVNVAYPIGKTAAESNLARAQLQKNQQVINVKDLELQVTAAVRQAVRDVQTNYQRVQASEASVEANSRQYDAEQRKQDVGLSTTFDVLQKQVLLAQARLTLLSSKIAYNQALQELERVQRIR